MDEKCHKLKVIEKRSSVTRTVVGGGAKKIQINENLMYFILQPALFVVKSSKHMETITVNIVVGNAM